MCPTKRLGHQLLDSLVSTARAALMCTWRATYRPARLASWCLRAQTGLPGRQSCLCRVVWGSERHQACCMSSGSMQGSQAFSTAGRRSCLYQTLGTWTAEPCGTISLSVVVLSNLYETIHIHIGKDWAHDHLFPCAHLPCRGVACGLMVRMGGPVSRNVHVHLGPGDTDDTRPVCIIG
jgi:hypothetical protein